MKRKRISCIYMIENLINCKKYVGQSVDFYTRYTGHKRTALTKLDNTLPLYSAMRKYGFDNFEFTILIKDNTTGSIKLDFWEDYFIDLFDTMNREKGYNCTSGGNLSKMYHMDTIAKFKVTNKQIVRNMRNKTGNYKGVSFDKEKQKWCGELTYNYKTIFLGYYNTEEDGAKAYNNYAMYLNENLKDNEKYLLNDIPNYINVPIDVPTKNKKRVMDKKLSQYNGVTYNDKRKNYITCIKYNTKSYYLGSNKNELECAKFYNQQALYYNQNFGTKYVLNDIPNYETIPKDIYTENNEKYVKNKSSVYRGVTFSKRNKKWQAGLALDKKKIHIGFYENEEDAARAYNNRAEQLNKEHNKKYIINELT